MGVSGWLQRAGGLLLPRNHFAQPSNCPECCNNQTTTPCECTCQHCSTTSSPAFTAPCCWTVVISGMTAGSCADCATLDRAYYLYQDPLNPCRWLCNNVAGVDCLGSNDASLTVYRDSSSGDYKIRFELGSLDHHRWIKNYGSTSPLCCEIVGDVLTHDFSRQDCDSSSATCTITRHTGSGRPCPCVTASCAHVIAPAPACLKIEWEGVSSRSPLACQFCECYTTTPQWIPWADAAGGACVWERTFSDGSTHWCGDAGLRVTIAPVGEVFRVTVWQHLATEDLVPMWQRDYPSKPDIATWVQEEIPRLGGGCPHGCDCDADAKVLLTADFVTSCDDRPWSCKGCQCQFFTNDDRPDVQVTLEGVEGSECCTRLNGPFILTPHPTNPCRWQYVFPDNANCAPSNAKITLAIEGINASLQLYVGSSSWRFDEVGVRELVACDAFDFTFTDKSDFQTTCPTINMPLPRVFTL